MFPNNKRLFTLASLVFIITVSVFLPALQNGFVNWDDNLTVYENPYIRSLDSNFLKYMFSFKDTMWIPLTRLSQALNYAVWGLDPMGHHLTSVLFHGFNTFLVVLIAVYLMSGHSSSEDRTSFTKRALIAGGVTGILFGIHPLRVESVVWVTEKKDVLSGFFVLLSLLYYLKFTTVNLKNKIRTYYAFSLVFFFMALMCKPMVVTLPAVLVILDIYPLRRFKSSQIKVIAEKVPFFALSLALSIVTVVSYKHEGIMVTESGVALMDRLLVAVQSISFYLYKMVWPVNLAPLYPYPKEISVTAPEFALPLVLITGITAFCIYSWKRQKVWSAVWAYFIVTLLPVLGVIKFGAFAVADRYTYLPAMGPFLLAGAGAGLIYEKMTPAFTFKKYLPVLAVLMVCLLSVLTVKQTKIWQDSLSLWNRELALYSSQLAYNNRGNEYLALERYPEAIADYNEAIELDPGYPKAYSNRGTAYIMLGEYKEAIADYNMAIKLDPGNAPLYYNRGTGYLKSERYREAIADFNKAVELDPGYALAYYSRGLCYNRIGDNNNTNRDFQQAARLGDKRAQEYLKSKGIDY